MQVEFNYEEFAESVTQEAKKYISDNLSEEDKTFVLEHFNNCALRSGKVLSLDSSLNLSNDEIVSVANIILEWIFKIAVALVESDIPKEFRHGIILDIGYVAFDITKDVCKIPEITSNQIFNTGEYHVINKLRNILSDLISNGSITEAMRDSLLNHSYINKSEKRIKFALNN